MARVNLSRLGKDSPAAAATLRRETRSAFGATRFNYTSAATGLHACTKAMRSGAFNITGLKCTFHVKRLGSLFVAFNKARQCTVRVGPRQYLITLREQFSYISPGLGQYSGKYRKTSSILVFAPLRGFVDSVPRYHHEILKQQS